MSNTNNGQAELAVTYKIDDNEIKLTPSIVQKYLVGSDAQITMPEFKMFTELCKVRKLNPFLKEAYCIKYGNQPATIVVGKDVIVKRAVLNPQYDGKESGVIVKTKNGELIERQGCFVSNDEMLVGGWAKVYRKDRSKPEYMSVSLDEVQGKKKDGSINSTWANKSATMVEKVAKVRALREAFVDDLAGMYVEDEMVQDRPQQQTPVVDIDFEEELPQEVPTAQEVDFNEIEI